jgi:signal transduction histidine kinase
LKPNFDVSPKKIVEKEAGDGETLATLRTSATLLIHEVANSLNGISAALQLINMKAQEQNLWDTEMNSLLGSATGEIKRLGSLLHDFRSFARPQKYNLEPTDLAKMIDEVIADEKLQYDSIGIQIRCEFPTALPLVMIDQEKMRQAILNICKNALEAMPSGGVLTFRIFESEHRVFLEIADTGAGIPNGLEVFQPFRTTKPLSSGLGLPVVSQIVSAHKGTIDYVSEPGKGATFKIGLPAGRA